MREALLKIDTGKTMIQKTLSGVQEKNILSEVQEKMLSAVCEGKSEIIQCDIRLCW